MGTRHWILIGPSFAVHVNYPSCSLFCSFAPVRQRVSSGVCNLVTLLCNIPCMRTASIACPTTFLDRSKCIQPLMLLLTLGKEACYHFSPAIPSLVLAYRASAHPILLAYNGLTSSHALRDVLQPHAFLPDNTSQLDMPASLPFSQPA